MNARGGGGTSILGGRGLDLTSSSEAKFGARFSQVHQIRGKIWEVLLPQDAKFGKESQFRGHLLLYLKFKGKNLGYLSAIFLEAKFGAPIRISEANIWGQAPQPLNMEAPPLGMNDATSALLRKLFQGALNMCIPNFA